jgi:hypothetical protein
MNSKLLFVVIILVIIRVIFELQQQIILITQNNAYAEWIIPSQLNEAYKNTDKSSTSTVRGQNNQPTTIMTNSSSSVGK